MEKCKSFLGGSVPVAFFLDKSLYKSQKRDVGLKHQKVPQQRREDTEGTKKGKKKEGRKENKRRKEKKHIAHFCV